MKASIVTVIGCGSLGALVWCGRLVDGLGETIHPKTDVAGLEAHETHASASLLGQWRTNMSAWLWVRTDLYLHNGTEMRPMTDQEIKAGGKADSATKEAREEVHEEENVVTVVPSRDRDFRGVLGDLDRATQAYHDMQHHTHNPAIQVLPLFRLMTWIDPQFIPAWTTAGSVISWQKQPGSIQKAVDFLEEGRKQNPKNVAILNAIGGIYAGRAKDPERALPIFQAACKLAVSNPHLQGDEKEAFQESIRWVTIIRRTQGDLKGSRAVAQVGLRYFPDDAVLQKNATANP